LDVDRSKANVWISALLDVYYGLTPYVVVAAGKQFSYEPFKRIAEALDIEVSGRVLDDRQEVRFSKRGNA